MRTGKTPATRGFTYVGLLFALALAGAALARFGEHWELWAQRERETELVFRGGELARALASYAARSDVPSRGPALSLEQLLADDRGAATVHHLRRLYRDPFADPAGSAPGAPSSPHWRLERDAQGAIVGVSSIGTRPALRRTPPGAVLREGVQADLARVGDWIFRPDRQTRHSKASGAQP